MKLCVSNDWLRKKIEDDADVEVEAGRVIHRSSDVVKSINAVDQNEVAAKVEQQEVVVPIAKAPRRVAQTKPAENEENVIGRLVQMVRRRDRLTTAQFADRIHVAPEEITSIEKDPSFSPKPRTVHKIAGYVNVPSVSLLRLLPGANQNDAQLGEAAHKFAASSENLPGLSRAERRVFNDFVKFLAKHQGGATDGK